MTSGIYSITNHYSAKKYIGSSGDIARRFSEHKRLLERGIHPNQHLQNSWTKHTEVAFSFDIILEVEAEQLLDQEQLFLDTYTALYNIRKKTTGVRGEHHPSSQQWILIDPEGNKYEVTGLKEFCRGKGLIDRCLGLVAQGVRKHHKGWYCIKVNAEATY